MPHGMYDITVHKVELKEPVVGTWYKDNDGDVLLFTGESPYPWLQLMSYGTETRSSSFPSQPLTEIPVDEIREAFDKILKKD